LIECDLNRSPAINDPHQGKFAAFVDECRAATIFSRSDRRENSRAGGHLEPAGNVMSRVLAALSATAVLALATVPTSAFAGCYGCYAPPPPPQPCYSCMQQVVAPPQYRTVNETVMVSPGRRIAHRTPARYETVMVPKTVMVEPEGVQYEDVPPQYATVQRTEQVAPARTYMVPARPRCGGCGY
jgi:hypothetical protein